MRNLVGKGLSQCAEQQFVFPEALHVGNLIAAFDYLPSC